jgi:hypothetical protein
VLLVALFDVFVERRLALVVCPRQSLRKTNDTPCWNSGWSGATTPSLSGI